MFDFGNMHIEAAVQAHETAWEKLLAEHTLPAYRPTTLSIKVADKATLYELLQANQAQIEQVHIGTVADRSIASAVLHEPVLGLPILKILERRPGSSDPLGLDSIDYLVEDLEAVFRQCTAAGLPIEHENNDMHAWLSLRFGPDKQFEAKIIDHIVLEVAIKELRLSIERLA